MAGTLYLIDSNILIRWVQPNDPDYRVVESALDVLARQKEILCYTSQNLGEFWNACTRPANRNGYGLTSQETDRRAKVLESKLRLLPDGLLVHQEWRQAPANTQCLGGSSARRQTGCLNAGSWGEAHTDVQ